MMSKKLMICAAAVLSLGVGVLVADDKPAAKPAAKPAPPEPTAGKKTKTASGLEITVVEEAKNPGAGRRHRLGALHRQADTASSSTRRRAGPIRSSLGRASDQGLGRGRGGNEDGREAQVGDPGRPGVRRRRRGPKIPPNATLVFDVELIGLARPAK